MSLFFRLPGDDGKRKSSVPDWQEQTPFFTTLCDLRVTVVNKLRLRYFTVIMNWSTKV